MYGRSIVTASLLIAASLQPLHAQRFLPDLEPIGFDGERVIGYAKPWVMIRVPGQIDGHAMDFILDTGCSGNAIDRAFRRSCAGPLGIVNFEKSPGVYVPFECFESCIAVVASKACRLESVVLWDPGVVASVVGGEVRGMLGGPFLADGAVGYRRFDHAVYIGRSSVRTFERTYSIEVEPDGPYTDDVHLNEVSEPFLIDTGASNLSVTADIFERLESVGKIADVEMTSRVTFNAVEQARQGVLDSVTVWGMEFEDVAILERDDCKIGLDVLLAFDFRIDYAAETIEVTEGPAAARVARFDRSGLTVLDRGGRVVIERIDKDSPASKAGLQRGDVVADVYSGTLTGRDLYALRYILTDPCRESVDLTIERDGERSVRRLTLR